MKPEKSVQRSSEAPAKSTDFKTVATNRRASHDYHIHEKLEAGIALMGCEVKSVRAGHVSLNEAFARVDGGELWLHGLNILPYAHSRNEAYEPARARRLLLHKSEILRLFSQTQIKGNALVPLRVYLTRGHVKVELGVAQGKQTVDKRETLKRKTHERETARAIVSSQRR